MATPPKDLQKPVEALSVLDEDGAKSDANQNDPAWEHAHPMNRHRERDGPDLLVTTPGAAY